MRFFILALSVLIANFTIGQRIDKLYDRLLSFEDFTDATDEWPQRYTTSEFLVIQDGLYKTKNTNPQKPSIISPKRNGPYRNFQIEMDLEILSEGNGNRSAGIACMIQSGGNSAIFVELNRLKQYRVKMSNNGRVRLLTGNAGNQGWTKYSKLSGKHPNHVRLNFFDGRFDLYLNGHFVETLNTYYLDKGDMGLFLSPGTEAEFDNIAIRSFSEPVLPPPSPVGSIPNQPPKAPVADGTAASSIDTSKTSDITERNESNNNSNRFASTPNKNASPQQDERDVEPVSFKEEGDAINQIAVIFKKTIDKQNNEIKELQAQVALLEDKLNKQRGSNQEVQLYEQENERLRKKLNEANGKVAALELEVDQMKTFQQAFLDKAQNKDLVLELTKLIAQLKSENSELKDRITKLQLENINNN